MPPPGWAGGRAESRRPGLPAICPLPIPPPRVPPPTAPSGRGRHHPKTTTSDLSCYFCSPLAAGICCRRGGPQDAARHPVWPPSTVRDSLRIRQGSGTGQGQGESGRHPHQIRQKRRRRGSVWNPGLCAKGPSPAQGGHAGCLAASRGPPLRKRLVYPGGSSPAGGPSVSKFPRAIFVLGWFGPRRAVQIANARS